MKYKITLIYFAIFQFGLLLKAQIPTLEVTPEDEAQIKAILEEYRTAWLNNDEVGVISLFEENARIQPSGMCPFQGQAELQQFWFPKDTSKTIIHEFDLEMNDLNSMEKDVIYSNQTTRLYWSYYKDSFKMGRVQYGCATSVFRRQADGNWKIWRQMWTDLSSTETRPIPLDESPFQAAFTILENDLIPEGMAYDDATGDFYLSSTWKRKIVKISPDGNTSDFTTTAQDGLLGALGMKVDAQRRLLWVVSSSAGEGMPIQQLDKVKAGVSAIFKYDLHTGKCLHQYWLDEAEKSFFLNDLTIDKTGRVYATEMGSKTIFTIAPDSKKLEPFFQFSDGSTPNGIDIDETNQHLFVALYSKPNAFAKINIATKTVHYLTLPLGERVSADGLYFYKNSLIAVQPFSKDRVITQYFLDEKGMGISNIKVLLPGSPLLNQPTTGAVVGDKFYFIGTSQLQSFKRHFKENGGVVVLDELMPVRIGVTDL